MLDELSTNKLRAFYEAEGARVGAQATGPPARALQGTAASAIVLRKVVRQGCWARRTRRDLFTGGCHQQSLSPFEPTKCGAAADELFCAKGARGAPGIHQPGQS